MDTLLVNLVLMGYLERDLSALVEYCEYVSAVTGVPIPPELSGRRPRRLPHRHRRPRGGRDQGVPQDRIWRSIDAVYSGVPASLIGREQEIEVGPMSGRVERGLLAGEARAGGRDRRARRPYFRRAPRRRRRCCGRTRSWRLLDRPPELRLIELTAISARDRDVGERRDDHVADRPAASRADSLSSVSSARCQAG